MFSSLERGLNSKLSSSSVGFSPQGNTNTRFCTIHCFAPIDILTQGQLEGNYEILANITYLEEVEPGNPFAPIFYVSPDTGKPSVTLATPLYDEGGTRQGIILVNLNLERIDRIVREGTGLGESGETYLVGSLVTQNTFISKEPLDSQDFPEGS